MVKTITEIESRAQKALDNSPIHALCDLQVERQGDDLLIFGRVSTFYYKQLAQEAILHLASDCQVVNEVVVDD